MSLGGEPKNKEGEGQDGPQEKKDSSMTPERMDELSKKFDLNKENQETKEQNSFDSNSFIESLNLEYDPSIEQKLIIKSKYGMKTGEVIFENVNQFYTDLKKDDYTLIITGFIKGPSGNNTKVKIVPNESGRYNIINFSDNEIMRENIEISKDE